MDIDGLGEELTEHLIDKGLVKNVSDIYYLLRISYPVSGGGRRVSCRSSEKGRQVGR